MTPAQARSRRSVCETLGPVRVNRCAIAEFSTTTIAWRKARMDVESVSVPPGETDVHTWRRACRPVKGGARALDLSRLPGLLRRAPRHSPKRFPSAPRREGTVRSCVSSSRRKPAAEPRCPQSGGGLGSRSYPRDRRVPRSRRPSWDIVPSRRPPASHLQDPSPGAVRRAPPVLPPAIARVPSVAREARLMPRSVGNASGSPSPGPRAPPARACERPRCGNRSRDLRRPPR